MSSNTPAAKALLATNADTASHVFAETKSLGDQLDEATAHIRDALTNGYKLLCCGNGGSAADSAHFCAEIAGRYSLERPGKPAVDLTGNHSLLTALINDYPPHQVFARQVQSIGQAGDVLAVFSTSGNSENVRLALETAKAKQIRTIAFLGKGGGQCKDMADVQLIVPSQITARIQEAHLLLYHTICEALDPVLAALGD